MAAEEDPPRELVVEGTIARKAIEKLKQTKGPDKTEARGKQLEQSTGRK
jgi:hypothetical protein